MVGENRLQLAVFGGDFVSGLIETLSLWVFQAS